MGSLELGELEPGGARPLTEQEQKALLEGHRARSQAGPRSRP
jgi:16S rRNA U516 pseudouridylate synthase RsuA-like enzyme